VTEEPLHNTSDITASLKDSKTSIRHIEEVLSNVLDLTDIDEIFIKELNQSFLKIYQINSLLGVGAFGVVL
jgi:hypothetical protein